MKFISFSFSKQQIYYSIFISLTLFSVFIAPKMIVAVLVITLFLSFYSAKYAIISISLAWLLTSLNPGIVSQNEITILIKQAIYFSALAGFLFRWIIYKKTFKFSADVGIFLIFATYVGFSGILISYHPDVTILKIILFTIGVLSVIFCTRELNQKKIKDLEEWFKILFVFITVASFPLLFSSLGFLRNERGFQGILNQPQLFGIIYTVITAFFLNYIIRRKKYTWYYFLLATLSVSYVFLSESRTAVLALFFSFILTIFIFNGVKALKLLLNKKLFLAGILLVFLLTLFSNRVLVYLNAYLIKDAATESYFMAMKESRGGLFFMSLNNFKENPMTGIGFGIGSEPNDMNIQYDSMFNLPISAPIEKGVAPVAILEETGIIGGLLFLFFLFYLLLPVFKKKTVLILPVLAVILINFGESTIFSFNAHAGILWTIILLQTQLKKQNA